MMKHWLILMAVATAFTVAGCGEQEQEQETFEETAAGWDGVHAPKGTKSTDAGLGSGWEERGTEESHEVDFKVMITSPGSVRINYQDSFGDLKRATLCADESCPANQVNEDAARNFQGQFSAPPRTGTVIVGSTWTFGYVSLGRLFGVIRCTIPEDEPIETVDVEISISIDGKVTQHDAVTVTRELAKEVNLQWPPRDVISGMKDKTG